MRRGSGSADGAAICAVRRAPVREQLRNGRIPLTLPFPVCSPQTSSIRPWPSSFSGEVSFARGRVSKCRRAGPGARVRAAACRQRRQSARHVRFCQSGYGGSRTSPPASPGRDAVQVAESEAVCRTNPLRWARRIGSFGKPPPSTSYEDCILIRCIIRDVLYGRKCTRGTLRGLLD